MATNFTNNNISSINIGNVNYNLKSVPFHATEAEWLSFNYVPKQAEIIVYDADEAHNYLRFKTGDGIIQASQLPFSLANLTEVYAYVNNQIASAGGLKRIILGVGEDLPPVESADINAIYMKRVYGSRLVPDIYEEYMVINGAWEVIGNTEVDLTNYATKEFVESKNYLTEDQFKGTVTEVKTGVGLKITGDKNIVPVVEIDEEVIFVFNCGTSTEII